MAKEVHTEDSQEYQFQPAGGATLRFKVKAAHDAHVSLSSADDQEATPIYEIFIGGWNNAKSAIRRDRTKPDRAEAETPDVLSGDEFRGFWVSWDAEGKVEVGRDGESDAFLSYVDPEPFPISYYGLRTAWGATGEWEVEGGPSLSTPDGMTYAIQTACRGSLTFSVRACHNAHVALVCGGPCESDKMYELFIGGWDNSKTALRKNRSKPDVATVDTPAILNSCSYRRFNLCWCSGLVTLKDDSGATLLQWQDDEVLPISHVGIRTTWGATGDWKFGAKAQDAEEELKKEEVEEVNEEPEVSEEAEADTPGEAVWVAATGSELPEGAVCGGTDHDCELIVARAVHEGALLPGKLVPSHGACYVSWGGAEHRKEEFEVLCGVKPKWVQVNAGDEIPANALPGGRTIDGETLFIGRVPHEGTTTVGKVHPSHATCYIPYGGEELGFPDYEIFVRQ